MNQRSIAALEKCIELLEGGVSVEDCIKKYPDLPPEFREILETTKHVMYLRKEQVPIDKMNRNRSQLLSHAKLLALSNEEGKLTSGFDHTINGFRRKLISLISLKPYAWRLVFVVLITGLLIIFSRELVITSAKSLPGDSLYPIKRVVEDISVYLVRNREIRQEYENIYSKQRVDEINRLITLNRKQQISFEGVLESQNDTNWMVSGISVILQANTTFIGGGEKVGLYDVASVVEVEGITNSEGGVTAIEIHLREYQFFGIVETIRSNFWQISGIQVVISSQTQIEEGIRVGDNVTVLMRSEDDGLYALAILREEHRVINPIIQQSLGTNQAVSGDITAEVEELHQIVGTLEKISDSYWVVNGQYVYIVGNSNIPTDIIVGDSIRVNYRIEANGSYTALEIKRANDENQLLENELQGTPEIGHESKCQETSIVNSPNDDEKNEGTATPEDHETSKPTGEYENTP